MKQKEIIFKAKRSDGKGWVQGSFFNVGYSCKIVTSSFNEIEQRHDFTYHEVIPETVCQFTGLKDKNGEKIFEGDELDLGDHHGISYVFYQNGSYKVNGKSSKVGFGSWSKITQLTGKNTHDEK